MNNFREFINEAKQIPDAYKSPQTVKRFIFGKYDATSGRPGYVHPFDLNLLSTPTRKNIEQLLTSGWTFDKIIISPVKQGSKRYGFSFVIIGKDYNGYPAIWNRKETGALGAGQTRIQWEDHQIKASKYLTSNEFKRRLLKAKIDKALASGDVKVAAQGLAEVI